LWAGYQFTYTDNLSSISIQQAMRNPKIPIALSNVTREGNQVSAHIEVPAAESGPKSGHGVLYIVVAENQAESHVARGENAGRSLTHVGVARVFKRVGTVDLGAATDKNITLSIDPGSAAHGSRLVAFIQDSKTGHVLAVTAHKL
jgi:hypothetical protein